MLDKIYMNKEEGYCIFIFEDGNTFKLSSDKDIESLLMWFLGEPVVQEDTILLDLDEVA